MLALIILFLFINYANGYSIELRLLEPQERYVAILGEVVSIFEDYYIEIFHVEDFEIQENFSNLLLESAADAKIDKNDWELNGISLLKGLVSDMVIDVKKHVKPLHNLKWEEQNKLLKCISTNTCPEGKRYDIFNNTDLAMNNSSMKTISDCRMGIYLQTDRLNQLKSLLHKVFYDFTSHSSYLYFNELSDIVAKYNLTFKVWPSVKLSTFYQDNKFICIILIPKLNEKTFNKYFIEPIPNDEGYELELKELSYQTNDLLLGSDHNLYSYVKDEYLTYLTEMPQLFLFCLLSQSTADYLCPYKLNEVQSVVEYGNRIITKNLPLVLFRSNCFPFNRRNISGNNILTIGDCKVWIVDTNFESTAGLLERKETLLSFTSNSNTLKWIEANHLHDSYNENLKSAAEIIIISKICFIVAMNFFTVILSKMFPNVSALT